MKKVLLSLAVAFGMIASANAQLVVGGGIDFDGSVYKTTRNGNWGAQSKTSNFGFGIAPRVGYIINDNLEVGAKLRFAYDQTMFYTATENVSGKEAAKFEKEHRGSDFNWSINPYARYRLFEVKGFGFWLQGELGLGTSMEHKNHYFAYGKAGETTPSRTKEAADLMNKKVDGHKYSCFNGSFSVKPVLTYAIDEHWAIESELNLLSLYLGGSVVKETEKIDPTTGLPAADRDGNEKAITETTNNFNWGLGLKQNQVLSLGVTYKF